MDLSTLNDEQLAEHLNDVLAEQERRHNTSPERVATIKDLTEKFIEGGGDPDELA